MILSLKCSNCGAALEVRDGVSHLSCGYCGVSQVVERQGGAVWLTVEAAIHRVQAGTDKSAAELALQRLTVEHKEVTNYLNSLRGKRAALQSTYAGWSIAGLVLLAFLCLSIGTTAVSKSTAAAAGYIVFGFVASWLIVAVAVGFIARERHNAAFEKCSKPIDDWQGVRPNYVGKLKRIGRSQTDRQAAWIKGSCAKRSSQ